ncbi:hypothetical protein A4A49_08782 [Nicotiana attenuata]|uniref:Uncharacterized protein n=1 Tax=Nicotiana attenuata TaxID=49451 RepID=A0A314LGM7_NICAT|nr:hypothetical protein A4A49_08782 [Nicotiana attenuata]
MGVDLAENNGEKSHIDGTRSADVDDQTTIVDTGFGYVPVAPVLSRVSHDLMAAKDPLSATIISASGGGLNNAADCVEKIEPSKKNKTNPVSNEVLQKVQQVVNDGLGSAIATGSNDRAGAVAQLVDIEGDIIDGFQPIMGQGKEGVVALVEETPTSGKAANIEASKVHGLNVEDQTSFTWCIPGSKVIVSSI